MFTVYVEENLQHRAVSFERNLNLLVTNDNISAAETAYLEQIDIPSSDMRVSLIDANGDVLYDNSSNPRAMENHADRKEIHDALQSGKGEMQRRSTTIEEETYYYAIRLDSGDVIRLAMTISSIYGIFIRILPLSILILILILIAAPFIARGLTVKIIKPLNEIDFDKSDDEIIVYDELAPFIRTISKQKSQIKKARKKVAKQEKLLHAIGRNMNEGVILADKYARVVSANKSAKRILGVTYDPSGKSVLELTRVSPVPELLKLAISGNQSDATIEIGTKFYHTYFSPVNSGVVILLMDVTEKAKAEKLRREFTANVSHELRTPLTTISGYAEMMKNGMIRTDDTMKIATKIYDESAHLILLIDDIMRLSKLDELENKLENKLENRLDSRFDNRLEKGVDTKCANHDRRDADIAFVPCNLEEIANETIARLQPKAHQSDIQIDLNIQTENMTIPAIPHMMRELFFNLLDNAIKYNVTGGCVRIAIFDGEKGDFDVHESERVDEHNVNFDVRKLGHVDESQQLHGFDVTNNFGRSNKTANSANARKIHISIADTGVGIAPENISRIFERFYREDKSRSKAISGTGLGLSIVKHIVEYHHGEIHVESKLSEGTTVEVVLPNKTILE
jgi:two-component system phosphate regulon sensor histidine kinase PhoR